MKPGILFFFITAVTICGCSTSGQWARISEHTARDSSFKLRYVVGKNEYVLDAVAVEDGFEVVSSLNKQRLEKKLLNKNQYLTLANQVFDFAREFHGKRSVEPAECKMPFMIAVTQQEEVVATDGCRSEDSEGRLGRIIRDAEILFYTDANKETGSADSK